MKLNWLKYYHEFAREHGGSPVDYEVDQESGQAKYLLFRDGWLYPKAHPAGPEVKPISQQDQLDKITAYWLIKMPILKQELVELTTKIRG